MKVIRKIEILIDGRNKYGVSLQTDLDPEEIVAKLHTTLMQSNQVEAQVSDATCETLQKRFDIYVKAINNIDDFFEYRYKNLSNEQIKEIVMNFIDTITLKLSKLSR